MRARRHLQDSFAIVRVIGNSMAPAFRHGDVLLARAPTRALRRGDVVVFKVQTAEYFDGAARTTARHPGLPPYRVKRIAACSGEQAPGWLPEHLKASHGGRVPPGHVVVSGDAPRSESSTSLGYIAEEDIEKVVVKRLRRGARDDAPPEAELRGVPYSTFLSGSETPH
jgi:signal peptidase I